MPLPSPFCCPSQTASKLFDMVKAKNDKGTRLPLWGTCMGFQLLHILAADDERVLELNAFDSEVTTRGAASLDYNIHTPFPHHPHIPTSRFTFRTSPCLSTLVQMQTSLVSSPVPPHQSRISWPRTTPQAISTMTASLQVSDETVSCPRAPCFLLQMSLLQLTLV